MFKSLNLKEAMATSIGMQWRHGATILTKFKLLNVISDQLMDCNVIINHYGHIAVHKLDRNYVKSLNLAKIVKFTYYRPRNCQNLAQISAQWTVVVFIISSKCQLFIPMAYIMLCESLEFVIISFRPPFQHF